MAVRPVFLTNEQAPYYKKIDIEFTYNRGLAKTQKQKNIVAIHQECQKKMADINILEISSKSMQTGGKELSAFSLETFVPELGKNVPVECVYQGSKVFEHGGPFRDLLRASPHDAKTDERLKHSGLLTNYSYNGINYPIEPKTFFYDFIYIHALLENSVLAEILLGYNAFTDIEFNPKKGYACQARTAAMFVSLSRIGLIHKTEHPETFFKLFSN